MLLFLCRHTPFFIAMKYRNTACAALLNPLVAEPLVWPSPWTFMSNLEPEAKALLEDALAQANDAWEKRLFSTDIPNADTGSHRTEVRLLIHSDLLQNDGDTKG